MKTPKSFEAGRMKDRKAYISQKAVNPKNGFAAFLEAAAYF
jgi:hypothetical protein